MAGGGQVISRARGAAAAVCSDAMLRLVRALLAANSGMPTVLPAGGPPRTAPSRLANPGSRTMPAFWIAARSKSGFGLWSSVTTGRALGPGNGNWLDSLGFPPV